MTRVSKLRAWSNSPHPFGLFTDVPKREASMGYFVYKVFPLKRLEFVQQTQQYREARDVARSMRKALQQDNDYSVKVIFAQNPDDAERLLTEEREPRPVGEE
jgi:hypothetical protein